MFYLRKAMPARMRAFLLQFYLEDGMAALQLGAVAPDFELPAVTGKQRQTFKIGDLKGKKNLVVAFYPLDWSPT
jgi:hypothetical protein